ncbi:YsnF/AvaK domain-containing protein [Argonema antarcticum]|uniref:YsnF/AvaK domain-containing protein n=1 Tax=Argonema antarcticum TaxID=2942763 RepID=UPI002011CC9B|nr:DUF2382 domain-containing protein [Argonema antarcticum]MCL1469939.1 DUF2382 domain-containing protein [Argonema antarcticum A004/B2]
MNSETSGKKLVAANKNLRIKVLLDKLRNKVKNFYVLDSTGRLLGRVKDVHLDKSRQLNLVISDADPQINSRPFLLRSSHIQQVNYQSQSLLVDISMTEIQPMSEHTGSQTPGMQSSQRPVEAFQARDTQSPVIGKVNVSPAPTHYASSYADQMSPTEELQEHLELPENDDSLDYADAPDIVEEEVIRLLEERLVVNLNKRKVGEVVVRKKIETRMVQVPVQYEVLIVEQVSPELKVLAEIDLGQGEIPAIEATETVRPDTQPNVSGEFTSLKTASLLLDAIAKQKPHGCKLVRVEVVLEDTQHQKTYQEWFDRCSET